MTLADGFTRGSQNPGAVPIAASPFHPIPAAIDVTRVDQFDVHPLLDEFLAENAGVVEAKVNAIRDIIFLVRTQLMSSLNQGLQSSQ